MAGTLQITDGTTTINLLNTSAGLYIEDGGWKPAVAQEDENGDYLDMIEVITCTWTETNDDDRAETLKDIKRLDRKAREHWRKRLVDGWVWLVANTHSETDTRYAIIKSIDIKELDPRHWAANGPVKVTLVIKHILWWGIAPNGTPTTVVNAETIYNKSDGDGDNWVTVAAADVAGDAPAIAIITVDPDTNGHFSHLTIARKRGSTADLNVFNPWLNADDELDRTHQADSLGPDDVRAIFTADSVGRWAIAAADIPEYQGEYLIYLVSLSSASGGEKAKVHAAGYNATTSPNELKSIAGIYQISSGGTWQIWTNLGNVQIPYKQFVPNMTYADNFEISLYVDYDSATVYAYAIALIPIDDAVFDVRSAKNNSLAGVTNNLVIDGRYETIYTVNGSGNLTTYASPGPFGRFITLEPNQNNRLYFFRHGNFDSLTSERVDPVTLLNYSAAVTVQMIPRYTSLRGND